MAKRFALYFGAAGYLLPIRYSGFAFARLKRAEQRMAWPRNSQNIRVQLGFS
jgi:hypothetical protein